MAESDFNHCRPKEKGHGGPSEISAREGASLGDPLAAEQTLEMHLEELIAASEAAVGRLRKNTENLHRHTIDLTWRSDRAALVLKTASEAIKGAKSIERSLEDQAWELISATKKHATLGAKTRSEDHHHMEEPRHALDRAGEHLKSAGEILSQRARGAAVPAFEIRRAAELIQMQTHEYLALAEKNTNFLKKVRNALKESSRIAAWRPEATVDNSKDIRAFDRQISDLTDAQNHAARDLEKPNIVIER